jgi:DnaJ C terminal domain
MRATIVRGVFFVMMANGPRPYAMPGAVALGKAIGLSETPVMELVGDMAGPLNGERRQVELTFSADALRKGSATFRYTALVPCTACGGIGADCKVCNEEGRVDSQQEISITFPADVKAGEVLRYDGKGDSPMSGGRPGDLFVEIAVKPG